MCYEKIYINGENVPQGQYCCTNCGLKLHIDNHQLLPTCPRCNNIEFTKEKG